ncbi:hypothetical protein C8F04DRAFT_1275081 [Mycena alexandri]|uniref:Uncharacterized protein n=1 Tax=Mycena alexandri TaxID=1745969 RepID=A0AAD6S523_9AGAR|nr:hypothetical protein C8F04DRAFT_1275081 [Mycena alexandri]
MMPDATRPQSSNVLTDEEDRAFKRRAPLDAGLRNWVDRYVPAGAPVWKPKPPGYVAGSAVRERVAARALAAARERPALEEKAFMRRSVGIPINPRPKLPGYVAGAAVRARVAARRERVDTLGPLSEPLLSREAREKAAKAAKIKAGQEAEAQRQREASAANVAELIRQRLAGEQRQKKYWGY